MRKRILSLLIMITMVFGMNTVSLADAVEYTTGPRSYFVDLTKPSKLENGYITENGQVMLEKNGYVEYNVFIPFEIAQVCAYYDIDDPVNVKWNFGNGMSTQRLSDSVDTKRRKYQVDFSGRVSAGDIKIQVSVDAPLLLRQVFYTKTKEVWYGNALEGVDSTTNNTVKFTPKQDAIRTAVIVNANSPIMYVNGARRYIDYNDLSKTPRLINGVLHMPIKAAAESLGYYYEEIYDKGYALLRTEGIEIMYRDGKCYIQKVGAGYDEIPNIFIQDGGTTWLPVRFLAELTGKKVVYKDGYTFIENSRVLIDNIIETAMFDEIKSDFNGFMDRVEGNTYYVAKTPNASDSNPGTSDAPFLTLNRASEATKPGDTVIVRDGEYQETFAPKVSGTVGRPIVYKAEEGANPVITTVEDVDITPVGEENGIYEYDLGWTLGLGKNMLFYKDEPLIEARHPNNHTSPMPFPDEFELSPLWATRGNIIVKYDKTGAYSKTDLNQPEGYWKDGVLVSLNGAAWGLGMAKIKDSAPGTLELDTEQRTLTWFFSGEASLKDYAYITCTKNAIDMPGEWHLTDEGKLYIMLPEGETPETIKLQMKKRFVTVDLAESKYIQLVNINTRGGGMKLNESEMCVINGGEHTQTSHYLWSMDQHYGFLEDCDFTDKNGAPFRGELGIIVGGVDNAVINTEIIQSAAAGLYMTGLYSYINNNFLDECGYMGSYVAGICVTPDFAHREDGEPQGGHSMMYNTSQKSGRAVWSIAGVDSWDSAYSLDATYVAMELAYNNFNSGSLTARDTGTVYTHGANMGDDRARSKFHHNVIYNTYVNVGFGRNLYWDNWIYNCNEYALMIFSNNDSSKWFTRDTWYQNMRGSGCAIPHWDNSELGFVDYELDEIPAELWPYGQKYRAGYNTQDYSWNYENIDVNAEPVYKAKDAKLSGSAKEEGEFVKFGKKGDMMTFENVDFGDKYNSFELTYRGDAKLLGDKIEVVVGNSYEEGIPAEFELSEISSDSKSKKNVYRAKIVAANCEGTKNVYIKSTTPKSAEFGALIPITVEQSELSAIVYGQVYAGDVLTSGAATKAGPLGGNTKKIIYNTMGQPTACFKNIEVPINATAFTVSSATDSGYASPQVLEVRVDAADGPVVAKVQIPASGWGNFVTTVTPTTTEIPKGTHDFYIKFTGGSASTDFWWFGFGMIK